ncbi:unnamed protein product, partial [Effrenium voratum]
NTVKAYNKEFCSLYEINAQDSRNAVPGVLYGRYAADQYGAKDGGNPWHLITAALASLLYQVAERVATGTVLSRQEIAAWKAAVNGGDNFLGQSKDFVAAGDSVLVRLRQHIAPEDDMHLFEQIDRSTGQQYNAKDLTWSYTEVFNALLQRMRAIAPGVEIIV